MSATFILPGKSYLDYTFFLLCDHPIMSQRAMVLPIATRNSSEVHGALKCSSELLRSSRSLSEVHETSKRSTELPKRYVAPITLRRSRSFGRVPRDPRCSQSSRVVCRAVFGVLLFFVGFYCFLLVFFFVFFSFC